MLELLRRHGLHTARWVVGGPVLLLVHESWVVESSLPRLLHHAYCLAHRLPRLVHSRRHRRDNAVRLAS